MKPKVFLVSFSELTGDGRVLRQIRALAPLFDLTVAGLGEDPSALLPGIPFRFVKLLRRRSLAGKILRIASCLPGWIYPPADFWPWSMTSEYRLARQALFSESFDFSLCNDLNAVLLGVEGLRQKGIPFIADYHEFAPGEASEKLSHRYLTGPHGHRCLRQFGPLAAGSMTVNQSFVDRFKADYGFHSIVVLNAPSLLELPVRQPREDGKIRLVYHGMAAQNRNLECMIRALPLLRPEFVLHLMVLSTPSYLEHLRREAAIYAPERVIFETPVEPHKISSRISEFDLGIFLVKNHSYNNREALPNKLFEYIHGGLALCCSRTPACEQFITEYQNGWLIDEVSSESLADRLNALSHEEIDASKAHSLAAREFFHADKEMAKLVALARSVLPQEAASRIPA